MEGFRTTIQMTFGKKLPAAAMGALDAWIDPTREAWALTSRLGEEKAELFRKLTHAENIRDVSVQQFKVQSAQLRDSKEGQQAAAKSYRLAVQV